MNEPRNIYPLLKYEVKNKEIVRNGPFSPVSAANEMAKVLAFEFQHLARVQFNNGTILQKQKEDGLTSYDHLVLVREYSNRVVLFLFIDMGTDYMPAVYYFSDDDGVNFTTIYKNSHFEIKPTNDQWLSMFKHMVDNPSTYKHETFDEIMNVYRKGVEDGAKKV